MKFIVECEKCNCKEELELNESSDFNWRDVKEGVNLGTLMISRWKESNDKVIKFECGNCKHINNTTYGYLISRKIK